MAAKRMEYGKSRPVKLSPDNEHSVSVNEEITGSKFPKGATLSAKDLKLAYWTNN